MAKTENKTKAGPAPFKKGEVTIDGVNFNDDWARKLKPRAANPDAEIPTPAQTAEEIFIAEYQHHYEDLTKEERNALLKKAFEGCLSAV